MTGKLANRLWVRGWIAVALTTQALGCGCGATPGRTTDSPETALDVPTTASAAASAGGATSLPPESTDPRELVPVLNDVRLAAARRASDEGNGPAAVQALHGAITEHKPTGHDRARWMYALAQRLAEAGDHEGAATTFDGAASEPGWPAHDYALLSAAKAYHALGKFDEAAKRASQVADGLPISDAATLLRADALDAMGSSEQAVQLWHQHLASKPNGARWAEGSVRLATALLDGPADANRAQDALRLVRKVLSEAPTAGAARKAKELEAAALNALDDATRRKLALWPVEMQLARAEALEAAGRRSQAMGELEELIDALDERQRSGLVGCSAAYLKAKILERDRKKRPAAADAFSETIRVCKRHPDVLVAALYRGAKIAVLAGRAKQSLGWFDRVEKEFPKNRLADDARLRGARVVLGMRDEPRFERMLTSMPNDYPEGDMVEDGLFELAQHHIDAGSWDKAIAPLEKSIEVRPKEKDYWTAGRARYFLALAYAEGGNKTASDDALRAIVNTHPLSYYMILAYGRLHADSAADAQGMLQVAAGNEAAETPPGPLPLALQKPALTRAVELLRLGVFDDARDEIRTLGLGSENAEELWTIARMYARAGATREAFVVARARSRDWSGHYPAGRWRSYWELAYPRPFLDIVQRETRASGIPVPLAYGIMREESAFDADVVSFADAYGLMQLIMPTAKSVARSFKMDVDDRSLRRPEVNIKLGCKLLSSLRAMFPQEPELAIPSYNAGAGATKRWLKNKRHDAFDLWVEDMPYDETRGYTKRVLSSVLVYAYLYEPEHMTEALALPHTVD